MIPALNAYIDDQDCVGACHLKNYFFCYYLPTRGWAGVKLGDAWYVQNVYIIFDAPCLFFFLLNGKALSIHHTICLVFRYTLWHFYACSGTNLLTSRHSASSLFYAVFVFQKSYTGNILGIGRNKSRTSRNSPKLPENRRGDRVAPRGPHTIGRCGPALGYAPYVWRCLSPLLTLPLRL
jgi:hypothetical protein